MGITPPHSTSSSILIVIQKEGHGHEAMRPEIPWASTPKGGGGGTQHWGPFDSMTSGKCQDHGLSDRVTLALTSVSTLRHPIVRHPYETLHVAASPHCFGALTPGTRDAKQRPLTTIALRPHTLKPKAQLAAYRLSWTACAITTCSPHDVIGIPTIPRPSREYLLGRLSTSSVE